jgi:hypothetical protein
MTAAQQACPCESEVPASGPGLVTDHEIIVRCVPKRDNLLWSDDGVPILGPLAFSKDELAGKDGKSWSVLREPATLPSEVNRRARLLTKEPSWQLNPILARAIVSAVRLLRDDDGNNWRIACVKADPTTAATDQLGPCLTHASVLRAQPAPDAKNHIAWAVTRTKLAQKFTDIAHCDGTPPAKPEPSASPN